VSAEELRDRRLEAAVRGPANERRVLGKDAGGSPRKDINRDSSVGRLGHGLARVLCLCGVVR